MEFTRPFLLLLVPLAILLFVWRQKRGREPGALRHSHLKLLATRGTSAKVRLSVLMPWVSAFAMILLLLGLAGPRIVHRSEEVEGKGIDIILSLDISGSMRSLDFEPNDRLGAAKIVIEEFIEGRPHDRIGLVVFAQKAFTQCPLTLDHQVLIGFLEEVEIGLIEDGTAIGLGLATAVARLRHSDSPSRTVVLLTDGVNTVPTLEPETAIELATSLNVRVYTVAIGRQGLVPFPVNDPIFGKRTRQRETKIDLVLLEKIAKETGGQMFQATDPEALNNIFRTIDELETARYKTTVSTWFRELMSWFVVPALLILLLEGLLSATWLRRLP